MSRTSIKAVDAYCDVINWDESLKNAHPDEIERWTKKRNKSLDKMRRALSQTNKAEFMRGCGAQITLWDKMIKRAGDNHA